MLPKRARRRGDQPLCFLVEGSLERFVIEARVTHLVKIWKKTLVLQLIGLSVSTKGEIMMCLIIRVLGDAECQFQGELVHYKSTILQEPNPAPSPRLHQPWLLVLLWVREVGRGLETKSPEKIRSARSPQKLKGDDKGGTRSGNPLSQGVYTLRKPT